MNFDEIITKNTHYERSLKKLKSNCNQAKVQVDAMLPTGNKIEINGVLVNFNVEDIGIITAILSNKAEGVIGEYENLESEYNDFKNSISLSTKKNKTK